MDVTTRRFDPTRPPAGRLTRLGVVFDWRTSPDLIVPLARMCERAGIEAIWVVDRVPGIAVEAPPEAGPDPWSTALGLAGGLTTATIGALIELAGRDAAGLVAALPPTRFEIGVLDGGAGIATATAFRSAAAAVGRRVRQSVLVRPDTDLDAVLQVVDDIVVSAWDWPDLETASDGARAAAVEAGRDASALGVAVLLPVSVGRTEAEAAARTHMDPDFARFGHPAEIGISGTLEECQDRVIALAHAGVTDLRCVLPATPDVHDVIAQLTAITIGTTEVLVPGSLRSPSPPPPDGWGGRPDKPPAPRVSAGSRRRG